MTELELMVFRAKSTISFNYRMYLIYMTLFHEFEGSDSHFIDTARGYRKSCRDLSYVITGKYS
jgi:hypothetical protein